MRNRASNRVASIPPYAFAQMRRTVQDLRARGIDVVDLGVGDPVRPAPEVAREACRKAIETYASSGYPPYEGTEELREEACAYMRRTFGVGVDRSTEVLVTDGSKEAIFHIHEALIDPGDGVLIPSPGYIPYYRGTSFAGGICIPYPLDAASGFLPDPDDLARRIDAAGVRGTRVRLLWLCHPNAPTGSVATGDLMMRILDLARSREVAVASDEAYADFVWEGSKVTPLQHRKEGIIAFYSLSKRSNMTGYRVGWACGDASLVGLLGLVKTNIDSGTPCFVQAAAAAALRDDAHVEAMRREYRSNMLVLGEALEAAGLEPARPRGAIYLWQRAPEGMRCEDLCERLLHPQIAIAALPGSALSPALDDGHCPGSQYVRFSMTALPQRIEEAARRIRSHLRF